MLRAQRFFILGREASVPLCWNQSIGKHVTVSQAAKFDKRSPRRYNSTYVEILSTTEGQ